MGQIGTKEAAKLLELSPRRVAAMISQGIIHATKVGSTWIIDEAEIARVRRLPRPPGRPRKKPPQKNEKRGE
jgi:excisionase family DNA binding protein